MKGKGMKKKNSRMINRQKEIKEVGNSETERKKKNNLNELKGRVRE